MSGLQTHDPGPPRCHRCYAEAAGRCAGCHQYTCADCCEIRTGVASPIAYCLGCLESGASQRHWRAWVRLVAPIVIGLAVLVGGIFLWP